MSLVNFFKAELLLLGGVGGYPAAYKLLRTRPRCWEIWPVISFLHDHWWINLCDELMITDPGNIAEELHLPYVFCGRASDRGLFNNGCHRLITVTWDQRFHSCWKMEGVARRCETAFITQQSKKVKRYPIDMYSWALNQRYHRCKREQAYFLCW